MRIGEEGRDDGEVVLDGVLVFLYKLPVFYKGAGVWAGVGTGDFSELSMGQEKRGSMRMYISAFRPAQAGVLGVGGD